jgi:hypothetical protein
MSDCPICVVQKITFADGIRCGVCLGTKKASKTRADEANEEFKDNRVSLLVDDFTCSPEQVTSIQFFPKGPA